MKKSPKSKKDIYQLAGIGISFGLEIGIATFSGWWIGNQMDREFETRPYLTLLGTLLFFSATIYHMLIIIRNLADDEEDRNEP